MISAGELLGMCHEKGIVRATYNVADGEYAIPSLSYLQSDFPTWWADKLKERGLGTWETTFDCDDFAWTFYTDIRWAHYKTRKSQAEGIAVGVAYYMSGAREEDGTGGGHAINTAVVGNGDERRVVFLEPQRAARGESPVLTLTAHELESIWFLNF